VYFNNPAAQHGLGTVTATTAGGTSQALDLNFLRMPIGTPGDVAVAANGDLWSSDFANPGHLVRISPASGEVLQTITLTSDFGTPYSFNYTGLQIVAADMTLGTTAVPAGSLLVFNGYPSPDRIVAVNTATGAVLGGVSLDQNYDLVGGVYDAATGHLFVLGHNANQMIELDAATGAQVAAVGLPLNIQSHSGIAIDPVTGNFWVGSYNGAYTLVEVTRAGAEVRRVDLRSQGVTDNEIAGLAFAGDGSLMVASTHGVIYRVTTA
jgi:sugar lactone lactonase YvrE